MLDVLIAVRMDLHSALHLMRTDVNESRLCLMLSRASLIRAVDTIDDAVRDIRPARACRQPSFDLSDRRDPSNISMHVMQWK